MFLETGVLLIIHLLLVLILLLGSNGMNGYRKSIFGTVISVSGKTFTLKRKVRFNGDSTTYTIDASNAIIIKNSNSSTELGIAPGDTVMVKGMISGIIFSATNIKDKKLHLKVPPPQDTEIF